MEYKKLIETAIMMLRFSYAPYSHFHVGASLLCQIENSSEKKIFTGCNIENASYGGTICAERVAITSAIASGYKKGEFSKLYVMCDSPKISSCCFICRQTISEFFSKDAEIVLYSNDGEKETYLVKDLCPFPFGSSDLK